MREPEHFAWSHHLVVLLTLHATQTTLFVEELQDGNVIDELRDMGLVRCGVEDGDLLTEEGKRAARNACAILKQYAPQPAWKN